MEKENKTLVIHPKDSSTDMLENVYKNHPEWTICRGGNIGKKDLEELISKHDRIIMLGHGTPDGLINSDRWSYIIDDSFAELLRTKETYSVWCYSDQYFERNGMHGFHTGMIISEIGEEYYIFGKAPLNEQEMLDNITYFCKLLGDCIEETPEKMKEYMMENYIGKDKVTKFNRERILVI